MVERIQRTLENHKDISMQATPANNFMVVRNRQTFGPFTASQLRQLAQANRLMPDDFVCRTGSLEKSRVRKIPSLFVLLHTPLPTERQDNGIAQSATSKDSTAIQTAIHAYGQRKTGRPELARTEPSGNAFKSRSAFYVDEVLCYGEFDLKTYQMATV